LSEEMLELRRRSRATTYLTIILSLIDFHSSSKSVNPSNPKGCLQNLIKRMGIVIGI
jgi:hypothetical protein